MSFKVFTTKPDPACDLVMEYKGSFTSPDCSKLEGYAVVHTSDGKSEQIPFTFFRNLIEITKPQVGQELVISAAPRMPDIQIETRLKRPDSLAFLSSMGLLNTKAFLYTWHVWIFHDTVHGRVTHNVQLNDVEGNLAAYQPDFEGLINVENNQKVEGEVMGGELTIGVEYYKAVKDEKKYIIKGTNPGQAAIESILTDPIARQIACQESKYKQFKGDREGGVGFPVIGQDDHGYEIGGVGIMQIYKEKGKTTPGEVWNWKLNLQAGLNKITTSHGESEVAHIKERKRLNKERLFMGLKACPERIPTKLTAEQVNHETIRRYNCGREYRWEPRNAPNCEGKWVVDLSCEREHRRGYDKDYVDKVLRCDINK